MFKQCSTCGVNKLASVEFFEVRTEAHGTLRRQCRICRQKKNIVTSCKWIIAHADKCKMYDRNRYMRNRKNRIRFASLIQDRQRALAHGGKGSYTLIDIQLIKESQNNLCYYCLVPLSEHWSTDHRIPFCRGGSNHPSNIVVACLRCNLAKNRKTEAEFSSKVV